MDYKLNSDMFRNMFGVPAVIADNHIKLASHSALKVILYILHSGTDAVNSDTPKALGISQIELDEALLYWYNAGVLVKGADDKSAPAKVEPKKAVVRVAKPTRAEISHRIAESKEISQVLRQAEIAFGRMLKFSEMSSLVYIIDELGVSPAVAMMIVQFAVAEERINASFLEQTAVRWTNKGIDSVAAAEKEMQIADEQRGAWRTVCRAMGIDFRRPSDKEAEASSRWVNEWGFSSKMLQLAYDECVNHSGKFLVGYTNGVLQNWHNIGISTPEQVANAAKSHEEKKAAEKASKENESPSYDLEMFERMLNNKG